jgi:hypothetical protein
MNKDADIGRIGENIVTNEFLARGFLVTHLDKGTRGVSANADLMVGHPGLARPALIQVKACSAPSSPDWIFLGALTEEALAGEEGIYNRKPGFRADYLAAVCVVNPKVYQFIILPIEEAESITLTVFRKWHAHPTRAGEQRKVVPEMYLSVTPGRERTRASVHSCEIFDAARDELLKYEDAFQILASGTVPQEP